MAKKSPNKDDILNAIKCTAADLGKRPSRTAFIGHTGISEYQILRHFPSWNSAVEAAGLEPDTTNVQIEDDELLADWGRLVRELRQIPTRVQYRHHGKYSAGSFEHHFGPWSCLPDKFREFAGKREEWTDVLALLPVKKPNTRFAHVESTTLEEKSAFEKIFVPTSPTQSHPKLYDRPVYGNHIDFRGFRHEPVNENGVIFLFGIVARELGYSVEAVQAGFPDCEAKRQIAAGKWQRVRIEFEYESRNFRDHGHSPEHCDVIVCWNHNWPDCPSQIEVVELSDVIQQLAKSDE
jgi:hypothetical protein